MRLVVAPPALAELHDAAAFHALKANVELGLAFVAEFERTASFVLASPLLGPVFRGACPRPGLEQAEDGATERDSLGLVAALVTRHVLVAA